MHILKASGKREEFDSKKIERTLLRAGADESIAVKIVGEVEKNLYDGITTKEILNRALTLLEKKNPITASKYDLKHAIMTLGPTGFPFERFFARVLENYGYKTIVGNILRGKCADHEIDISAEKIGQKFMIECKYHNTTGIFTGLKVSLYTYARFLDLEGQFDTPWLVTNTRITNESIKYARCQGMKVTSWKYPGRKSLERLIEDKKLYPITILRSLRKYEKEMLMQENLMLVNDLLKEDLLELKKRTNLPKKVLEKARRGAESIYYYK